MQESDLDTFDTYVAGGSPQIDERIRKLCKQYPQVLIMGTGVYGTRVAKQMEACGLVFVGFVVSDDHDPHPVMGRPTWRLNEQPFEREKTGIVVAMNEKHWNEVKNCLEDGGYHWLYPFDGTLN